MLQTFVESYHYSTPFLRRHVVQARETGRSLYRSQRARERNDTTKLTVINVDGRTQLYSSNMGQSTFGFERQISNQLSFYFIH
jgi:hypothetical protein